VRALVVFGKCARQQRRDPIGLALTLGTAPAFVALYGLLFRDRPAARDSHGAIAPFDAFVPGLLVFAVIMVVFSAAMSVAKEVESGALRRLRLTPLRAVDYLGGISLFQLLLGAGSVSLTLLTAALLGFDARGAGLSVVGLGILASAGSVGIGMMVATVSPTTGRVFLVASVAMFLLLLFSGVVFPRPEAQIFDLLPTTQLHLALSTLWSTEPSPDVGRRAAALLGLSLLYFGAGVFAFDLRHGLARRR
jgi:ABC-2 type transport system permease protein